MTTTSFRKNARGMSWGYDVYVGDVKTGVLVGYVFNNGARTTYGRHWTAIDATGAEVTRTGSRAAAAEALIRTAQGGN